MFAPSVGTMMNGARAFATSGGTAWRRRQRRLRAFRRYVLWHSKMEVAAALHHTSGMRASTTAQFSTTAVDPSAPRVVGSLPPVEEFSLPVFYQVHQEQSVAGEITENIVEFPVVQEQVIVQAISRVAGSLPPVAEFTEPVYNPFHQEQFSAGETTENIAKIPVVQEQVLVQAIPRVVGSSPPVEEFSRPVYNHVHQEQFAAVPVVGHVSPVLGVATRRPSPLVEVRPSVRAQRHVVEQLADIAPMVQILDSPEPQMVVQLLEVFRLLDTQLPDEQAISVPKISCSPCPSRSRVPEPQSADQLVEVPTVLSPTRIALQIAEQIVDTPVPRSRVRGSLPGQSSTSSLPDSIEWVELSDANGKPYFWNRRSQATVRKAPPGVQVVWVGVKDEVGGTWYWHRRTRATGYLLPPLPPE